MGILFTESVEGTDGLRLVFQSPVGEGMILVAAKRNQLHGMLQQAIDALTVEERKFLTLHHHEKLSLEQVAIAMAQDHEQDHPNGTGKGNLNRVRQLETQTMEHLRSLLNLYA